MANEIRDAFNTTYADGPVGSATEPQKSDIRAIGGVIQGVTDGIATDVLGVQTTVGGLPAEFDALSNRVDDVESLASAGIIWTPNTIRVRSTANVNLASGLVNAAVLNGVTLATGDFVFLGSQTAPAENGIYTVVASGAASRAAFADTAAELAHIGFVLTSGTAGAGERWTLPMAAAAITLGTTALNFALAGVEIGVSAEVIAARGNETSLGNRLNNLVDFDPASARLFAAMTTPPTTSRKAAYDRLITRLKRGDLWNRIDAAWMLAAADSQAAGLNLKGPGTFTLTPINAPTFTADQGYAGNGTTSYLKTGFIPSTNGAYIALNNAHLAVFNRTERAGAAGYLVGASGGGGNLAIAPRDATNLLQSLILDSSSATSKANTSHGLIVGVRDSSSSNQLYRDGVSRTVIQVAGTALVNREIYIGANNNNGSPAGLTTDQCAFACVGGKLTVADVIALNNAVYDYLIEVGAATAPSLVVCDGNSLTFGTNSTAGTGDYPYVLSGLLTADAKKNALKNTGIAGQTSQMMMNAADVDVWLGVRAVSGKKVLLCWEILNDMRVNSVSAQDAINNLRAYCYARRQAGWEKIIVINQIPTGAGGYAGTWGAGSPATVNALLASQYAQFADALVDLSGIANLQTPTNTTYFAADTIHLTDAGYALVAGAAKTVVETFI
ncbi:SGNH/GDSL hydrolase family protein [Mesorhizobium sp. M0134]|uniref:SGNH/GDSL hydrolase family protein n=1 Tax=Mesorhizobium sp. M0134 TaxID=2956889 RepID=UPI00333608FC